MYRVIFLGSPDFAIPSLEALFKSPKFEVVAVFSQPDKPVGRKQILTPADVKKRALELNLNVYTPDKLNTAENLNLIKSLKPDFLFTAAYGQIISEEILKTPKIEALNLHGSLLPKYRGASPIQTCLLNGDKETGVTFMRMVKKMDAGEMFYQHKIKIEENDNAETLFQKIAKLGGDLTPEILIKIASGNLQPIPQNEAEVSYCKKITKENGKIDWKNETAAEIYNKIRAYTPWPGCYTDFNGKKLKIIQAIKHTKRDKKSDDLCGKVIQESNKILVSTKKDYLEPMIIQLEGKKELTINEFSKGKPDFVGSILK